MPSPAELLELGMSHHRAGRLDQAEQAYSQLRRLNPDHPDALHLLGVIAHQRGDPKRAIGLINMAIASRAGVAAMHANLAEAYRAAGDLNNAIAQCKKALELQPMFAQARSNLGLALTSAGKMDEALKEFREVLKANPRDGLTHNNLANTLRMMGRDEDALAEFRLAVQHDPLSAEFQSNLGQFLLEMGQTDEAEVHCRNAVRLAPALASAHSNLGNVLRTQRKLNEAIAAYQEALRLRPDMAITHNNMGQAMQEMGGHLEEAVKWYKQSLQLDPRSARALTNLASALEEAEQDAEAERLYRAAIEVDPRYAEAYLGLAGRMRDSSNTAQARELLEKAISIKPRMAVAYTALSGIYNELGEFERAQELARKALEIEPHCASAIGSLQASMKDKLPAEDAARAEKILNEAKYLNDGQRCTLNFALGASCDGRKEYEKAAAYLAEANALCKKGWQRYKSGYSPEEHERFVEALVATFTPELFAKTRGFGSNSELPVYILGLPRSGTTLLEQILSSHPQVHGAGELRLVRDSFEGLLHLVSGKSKPMECVPHLGKEQVDALASDHLAKLKELAPGKDRIVDKMPDNYLYLGYILLLHPRAKIIHSRRDLRDIGFSCWLTHFSQIRWASDLDWIHHRFSQYARVMDHWRKLLPDRFIEVDYESTVEDVEGVARKVISFLGLEWNDACLAFHENKRPVRTASLAQVRQPIYARSKGRWANYEPWLGDWFKKLAALKAKP